MKKFFCLILALSFCLSFLGCQKTDGPPAATDALPGDGPVDTAPPETGAPAVTEPADTNPPPSETLPPLADDEKTVLDGENYAFLYGTVTAVISPTILVMEPDGRDTSKEYWGEQLYVLTDDAEEWCVGDRIMVDFTLAEVPNDPSLMIRLTAEKIYPREGDETMAKPIIYFYPEKPTELSVSVSVAGHLSCTYPDHGREGWQGFTAYPDGTLVFPDGKEYYALYWEGKHSTSWDFSTGWCVSGEDTAAFLEWALQAQGLSPREANEFIIYWLPLMQDNAYNVIAFQSSAYTDAAQLRITPEPDTLLRVFMAYYPSDSAVAMEPQAFTAPERQGFTVVEWGGSRVETP